MMIGQRAPYNPDDEERISTSLGWISEGPGALMQQIEYKITVIIKDYERIMLSSDVFILRLVRSYLIVHECKRK